MASRPTRGPYPESYVPSDKGSKEWHDYTKVTEVASADQPKLDLLFVHGLGNRWQQTWCGSDGSTWLQDLLPGELAPSRILVSGFNCLSRIDGDLSPFSDGCEQFIEDLQAARKDDEERPIILVGHSLGGLVLQQALPRLQESSLQPAIKGILFFGTPHFCEDAASWKKFRKQIGKMLEGNEAPSEIKESSITRLGSINTQFDDWLSTQLFSHHVYRFYEGLPVYRIGVIVSEEDCKVHNADDCIISADHLGIVKYEDPSDPFYQIVLKRLKTMYSYKDTSATSSFMLQSFTFSTPARTTTNESQLSCPDAREDILASDNVNVKLALALEDQGQYRAAEQAYKDAITDFAESLGERDRLTLYCMDKLSSLMRDRSHYDEAAKLSKKVLAARIEEQGLGSSATLSSAANLALIMRYQSKHQEAFSMLRNALENSESRPFGSITRTRIVSVLAKIFRDHGAYDSSELLSRDVSRASAWWLGEDHPFTLNRQSDLSVAYSTHTVENRYLVAEDLSRQVLDGLEKSLGRDHPNALRTARRLGNFLRFEGDTEAAAKRLEKTWLRQKEQVGAHHPNTLTTMTCLAAASVLQGYVGDARRMLEQAVEEQKELLGAEHQSTLWTIEALERLKGVRDDGNEQTATQNLDHETSHFFSMPSQIQRKISLDPVPVLWDSNHPLECALIDAVNSDSVDTVKAVLKDVKDPDILGRALRVASYTGRDKIVRLLLEFGTDVDSRGGYYGTAVQAAAAAGHLSVVEFLLEMNADINIQAGILNTALRAAVFKGHGKIIKLLLDSGANPNTHGEASTPLQVAVGRGDIDTVRMLLDRKADPNAPDHLFGTPLQEASFHGQNDIISLLITSGADPNLPGGLYGSAMQAALRASHRETVKLLMDNGADASSYNMLNAIMESGMDLVDVSFGRHTSDLFVMEPKFAPTANVSKLRFCMRKETHKVISTVEGARKEEYSSRARTPPRPLTPKEKGKDRPRDVSKTRKGLRHLKILGR